MLFKKKIANYIASERLLEEANRKIIVTLSGGADSVALLCVLHELGYQCLAVHCNFHLRGAESDRDEEFVRLLCVERHVPLQVVHFDTTAYAVSHHISIEMAARELRYAEFERIRLAEGAAAITVAHHRDDSVETVLLNLIRGTGINGLKGIRPRNGYVVRPLLCVSRSEILDYLATQQQDYVTDSTNLHDDYTRNKIRLNLLPLMREINPSVSESIAATAERLADVAAIYNKVMEEEKAYTVNAEGKDCFRIDITRWRESIAPHSLLYEILSPYGFNAAQLKDIAASADADAGKRFRSSTHEALKDRDCWMVFPLSHSVSPTETYSIDTPCGTLHTSDGHTLSWETFQVGESFVIPRSRDTLCLDAAHTTWPLTLRPVRQGDRFIPFGMHGKKLVSDYLTDRKLSLHAKQHQWVLEDTRHILWLAGERSDERERIGKGCTTIVRFVWK